MAHDTYKSKQKGYDREEKSKGRSPKREYNRQKAEQQIRNELASQRFIHSMTRNLLTEDSSLY